MYADDHAMRIGHVPQRHRTLRSCSFSATSIICAACSEDSPCSDDLQASQSHAQHLVGGRPGNTPRDARWCNATCMHASPAANRIPMMTSTSVTKVRLCCSAVAMRALSLPPP